jgi:hypothetical protein
MNGEDGGHAFEPFLAASSSTAPSSSSAGKDVDDPLTIRRVALFLALFFFACVEFSLYRLWYAVSLLLSLPPNSSVRMNPPLYIGMVLMYSLPVLKE